jgi:hypothetical protein
MRWRCNHPIERKNMGQDDGNKHEKPTPDKDRQP